jgi:mannosyltransferase OCH1-like enzyme
VIPRVIHHIWIGPDPIPDEHRRWIGSWKRLHPKWEHRLWTEDDLPNDPIRPEILERLRAPVERADILRLEILYRHGGVYVDTDVECLRPVDDALAGHDFVGVCLKPGRMTNTFIASVPAHPLLERALQEAKPLEVYWTLSAPSDALKEVAGPPLLRRLVRDYPDVELLEPPLFFPSTDEEREQALGVHHLARTWHNLTALRTAMHQAERRLEETKRELEKERRRHAATKRRLAKAEGRAEKGRAGRRGIRGRFGLLRRRS